MPRSTRHTTKEQLFWPASKSTGHLLNGQDVADAVKKLGVSVGLTTIYRNLDTLVEEGVTRKFVVDKILLPSGEYLDDPYTEEFRCRAAPAERSFALQRN